MRIPSEAVKVVEVSPNSNHWVLSKETLHLLVC